MDFIYIFGVAVSLEVLSVVGIGVCVFIAFIFAFLNATHNSAHGDYGVRQALFMHSIQDRARRPRDDRDDSETRTRDDHLED